MTKSKWIVVCLPFLGCFALLGCPKTTPGGTDAAASAAPDPSATAQTTVTTVTTTTDGGKTTTTTTTVVLPKLNLDGSAALMDAAVALLGDAGIPAIPTIPTASTTGTTGVPPECDQYATKQTACIQKMAPALQPAALGALGAAKASWPTLAATPAGHDALLAQCKNLLAQANACK